MQVELQEYDGSFSVEGTAVNTQEAATVMRLGMSSRKGCRVFVSVSRSGEFRLSFTTRKAKNGRNYISR